MLSDLVGRLGLGPNPDPRPDYPTAAPGPGDQAGNSDSGAAPAEPRRRPLGLSAVGNASTTQFLLQSAQPKLAGALSGLLVGGESPGADENRSVPAVRAVAAAVEAEGLDGGEAEAEMEGSEFECKVCGVDDVSALRPPPRRSVSGKRILCVPIHIGPPCHEAPPPAAHAHTRGTWTMCNRWHVKTTSCHPARLRT